VPRRSSFASDTEAEMSDERRAEIEAVAEVLQEAETGTFGETYLQVAMGVLAALDRVRDARGDDEDVKVTVAPYLSRVSAPKADEKQEAP
jgi:broad specificity phosphatase PhoE